MSSIYSKTESALCFLQYALRIGAVRFGEFEMKSGRKSPCFFDIGKFSTGRDLSVLGAAYTKCIVWSDEILRTIPNTILGPAYKGIPLATLVATKFFEKNNLNLRVCFTRKEQKYHGEGGKIIGTLGEGDRVIIVDDVITDGATKMEAVEVVKSFGATVIAVVIAFDRQESGDDPTCTAAESFTRETGIPVISVSTAQHLIALLREGGEADREHAEKIERYFLANTVEQIQEKVREHGLVTAGKKARKGFNPFETY